MGADNTFKLKIVASNRVFYDGRAQTLVIPAIDGGEVGSIMKTMKEYLETPELFLVQ